MKKTIVLVVLALVGCDKKSDSAATTTTTATASVTANEILTATTTAPTPGVTATATASAAGNWPAYLPDYPGATTTKRTKDLVSLETKDAPDKVVAFYKDKLRAAGFPPGAWATLGAAKDQATVMTASKGSDMVQVTVTPVQGTTKISLSIL
jgi:hypothetical protein